MVLDGTERRRCQLLDRPGVRLQLGVELDVDGRSRTTVAIHRVRRRVELPWFPRGTHGSRQQIRERNPAGEQPNTASADATATRTAAGDADELLASAPTGADRLCR